MLGRFPDLLILVNEITNKKLMDLKCQTEQILDTLLESEMNIVFTNDSKYLSARDDLLAVTIMSFRKLQPQNKIRRGSSSNRSDRDWMDISR